MEKLGLFDEPFSPKTIGTRNDYEVMLVKAHGEFVWHTHDETDDFFLFLAAHDPARGPGRRGRAG